MDDLFSFVKHPRPLVLDTPWCPFRPENEVKSLWRMRFQLVAEGVLRWLYLPVAECATSDVLM